MNSGKITVPNAIMLGEVTRLIREGHSVVIMTKGYSMLPFIIGDRDSVELVAPDNLKPGDIALAQIRPGVYVLHRIIAIEGDGITLKGDGNLVGTEKCTVADICGVATKIILPSGKETDCTTPSFVRRSRIWRNAPYIVRRLFLGIFRRLIKVLV